MRGWSRLHAINKLITNTPDQGSGRKRGRQGPAENALRERKAPTQRLFVLGAYQGHTGDQKGASLRFLSHAHEPLSQLIE
jgi:hypothetical protein